MKEMIEQSRDQQWEPRAPEAPRVEAARTALLEYANDTDCDMESMAGFADGLIVTARRDGMIKALRWVIDQEISATHAPLFSAVTRLENGGEL